MVEPKPIQLLVLQSTAFCNIDCSYCYLPDRSVKGQMRRDVLDRIAKDIILSRIWTPNSLLVWHAGEPMILGTDWYAEAHKILDAGSGRLRRIHFQSNVTVLNSDWIDFLRRSGALIGVSIDGPEWLHDKYRRDRAGQGTFDRVMQSVALLQAADIPFTNIATVTRESLSAADEIFDFFFALQPKKLAFSIEEAEGANTRSSLYHEELIEHVEEFFRRIAERNFRTSSPLHIREIDSVISGLMAPKNLLSTSQETELGRIVAISANGDVALYSPELLTTRQHDGTYATVGNILEQSMEEIFRGKALHRQTIDIQRGVDACKATCQYYGFCGGGSPANKYFEMQRFDLTETWHCRIGRQAVARGVLRAIVGAQAPHV
jgi:uncharacterized protein